MFMFRLDIVLCVHCLAVQSTAALRCSGSLVCITEPQSLTLCVVYYSTSGQQRELSLSWSRSEESCSVSCGLWSGVKVENNSITPPTLIKLQSNHYPPTHMRVNRYLGSDRHIIIYIFIPLKLCLCFPILNTNTYNVQNI